MKFITYTAIVFVAYVSFSQVVDAQTMVSTTADNSMSSGIVKKVDLEQGKVTINHGPLLNLEMPAMTMVFRVIDLKLLDNIQTNNKINFIANKINGVLTVERIEKIESGVPNEQLMNSPTTVVSDEKKEEMHEHIPQTSTTKAVDAIIVQGLNPSDSTLHVANPVYESAFKNYQTWQEITEAPGKNWRAANDEAGKLGGHVGQLRDSSTSEVMPKSHDAKNMKSNPNHDMKNMKKGSE